VPKPGGKVNNLLQTTAQLFFRTDGSLDRIVIERYYDRIRTLKFLGTTSDTRDHHGLKLASTIDKCWNLKEGDVHYVHFIVESVEFD
jgi:hypothetical protein